MLCEPVLSKRRVKVMIIAVGLGGQLHLQVVLQVVSLSLHSRQRRGGLQSVLRRANIVRDSKWGRWE